MALDTNIQPTDLNHDSIFVENIIIGQNYGLSAINNEDSHSVFMINDLLSIISSWNFENSPIYTHLLTKVENIWKSSPPESQLVRILSFSPFDKKPMLPEAFLILLGPYPSFDPFTTSIPAYLIFSPSHTRSQLLLPNDYFVLDVMDWLRSLQFQTILDQFISLIDEDRAKNQISKVFFEFPESHLTEIIIKQQFRKDLDWKIYKNPYELVLYPKQSEINSTPQFSSSYYLIKYFDLNPSFLPKELEQKMQQMKFLNDCFRRDYVNYLNPCKYSTKLDTSSNCSFHWHESEEANKLIYQALLEEQKDIDDFVSKVQASLNFLKNTRKILLSEANHNLGVESMQKFFHDYYLATYNLGFRFHLHAKDDPKRLEFIRDHLSTFQLLVIHALATKGTMWDIITSGSIDLTKYTAEYFNESLGPFVGFVEITSAVPIIGDRNSILVGWANSNIIQKTPDHSRRCSSGLEFLTQFRGLGLGQLITLIGISQLDRGDHFDILYELSSMDNYRTINLARRVGFIDFGIVKNKLYSFHNYLNGGSVLIGNDSKWRLSSKILENLDILHLPKKEKGDFKQMKIFTEELNQLIQGLEDEMILPRLSVIKQ